MKNLNSNQKNRNLVSELFLVGSIFLTGCNSSSVSNDDFSQADGISSALDGEQIRQSIVGNTLKGTNNSYPRVGPIDFELVFLADGSAKDRLFFLKSGSRDKANGTWRIADEQRGILCNNFPKRDKTEESCWQIQLSSENQFKTIPTNSKARPFSGTVILGNQIGL